MERKYEVFLTVAETLNMSRAAKIQCVSHQCISNHIACLESEYGVKLFVRVPRLALTEEGKVLLRSVRQMHKTEKDLKNHLLHKESTEEGFVRLGLPGSRYSMLALEIVSKFKEKYPNVIIEIQVDYSGFLMQKIIHGDLDFAVVVQQEPNLLLNVEFAGQEQFYCLLPEVLLTRIGGEHAFELRKQYRRGMDIESLRSYPIIFYPIGSRIRAAIDEYSKENDIPWKIVLESNQIDSFDQFSRAIHAVSIVPEMALPITIKNNQGLPTDQIIHAYPINSSMLNITTNMALIKNRMAESTNYKQDLSEIICAILHRYCVGCE